ncbi:MAG: glycosyltransferase [Anaerolineae bacterium]|nr:glycosyltransferase [Anaerolineae bacterium]
MPKVSVITPTYNRADMLGDAIQSVLAQDLTDWELIVVDDGSRDNTREVVAGFADPRIRYIYQENKGLPGARNTGIRNGQGQYVAFLDSDDLFSPGKLTSQAEMLDERPDLGLVAGGYWEVDKQLRILRELRPWHEHPTLELHNWLLACPFCPTAPLVRQEWLDKVGLFDETMRYVEDWDLWLRLSYAGCRMDWLPQMVCRYRIHGNTMTRNVQLMKAGMLAMFDKFYAQPDLPAEVLALRDAVYANVYLNTAARAYAAGDVEEGKECVARATALDPSLLQGDPPRVLGSLTSFALTPLVNDAETFMDMLVSNLPEGAGLPRYSKRKARGLLHAVNAFEHSRRDERRVAARHALSALLHDPGWLRNRGLLSLVGQAMGRRPA